MNSEPLIRPLPTADEFRAMADVLVPPECGYNDEAAKAYIDTVLTIANPEDDHSTHLANTAARHAFMKTEAFETAFREFAGIPERPGYVASRKIVHVSRGM